MATSRFEPWRTELAEVEEELSALFAGVTEEGILAIRDSVFAKLSGISGLFGELEATVARLSAEVGGLKKAEANRAGAEVSLREDLHRMHAKLQESDGRLDARMARMEEAIAKLGKKNQQTLPACGGAEPGATDKRSWASRVAAEANPIAPAANSGVGDSDMEVDAAAGGEDGFKTVGRRQRTERRRAEEKEKRDVLILEAANVNSGGRIGRDEVATMLDRVKAAPVSNLWQAADQRLVVVQLQPGADAKRTRADISAACGNGVTVREPADRGRMFAAYGVLSSKASQQLTESILRQNPELVAKGELEVRHVAAARDGKPGSRVLIRVTGATAGRLAANPRLVIDYQAVRLRPFAEIRQCFRCCRYGHSATSDRFGECKQTPRCLVCGGDHERKDCKSGSEGPAEQGVVNDRRELACVVCLDRHGKMGRHRADSSVCPVRSEVLSRCLKTQHRNE